MLSRAELQKIGIARALYAELDDNNKQDLREVVRYRAVLDANRLSVDQDDPNLPIDHDDAQHAVRSQRDEAALAGRIWPSTLLYRYLVPPLRDTLLELFSGRRIRINLLKIFLASIIVVGIIVAAFYFPPLVGFFAANALSSAAGLGMIASLGTTAVYFSNEIIKGVERVARARHWSRYECYGTQVNLWNEKYSISEDTLEQMNAYLINKLENVKSKQLKGMYTKLLEKFEISKRADVHALGVFFAEELNMLIKSRSSQQYLPAELILTPIELEKIKEQLDTDIETVSNIVDVLRTAPNIPLKTKAALDVAHGNTAKQKWNNDLKVHFNELSELIDKDDVKPDNARALYGLLSLNLKKLEVGNEKIILRAKGEGDADIVLDKKEDYPQVIEWLRQMDEYKQKLEKLKKPDKTADLNPNPDPDPFTELKGAVLPKASGKK